MSKYHDLKADLAVDHARVLWLEPEVKRLEKALSDLGEWSRREIGMLRERNAHQARLIDEARDERDGSNLLLGRILDQLDRDLGAERDGPLSDLRRDGRLHVGWDTEH